MGVVMMPRSAQDEARARARKVRGGRWPTIADQVEAVARAERIRTRWTYGLLALLVLIALNDIGPAVAERHPDVPQADLLTVFGVGACGVLLVKLYERARAGPRLVTVLWTALRWASVPPGRAPRLRVEPEVSGRLVYAASLARTQLASTAGSSAYGSADGPRRKAGFVADRLRDMSEWPFRQVNGRPGPGEWQDDVRGELVEWITVIHEGTWYRKVPDNARTRFDDLIDLRVASALLACLVVVAGAVLDGRGSTGDLTGEAAAVVGLLVLVGRPAFCAIEALGVVVRGMLGWIVAR